MNPPTRRGIEREGVLSRRHKFRIQLLVHYNFPCSEIQQPYNQSKLVFPSNHMFPRARVSSNSEHTITPHLWVRVERGTFPNAGGYPRQGHGN